MDNIVNIQGHGAKFSRRKEQAILALMTEPNIEQAAHAVGIEKKTLLRWMKTPEFQEEYATARREAFSQAIARLQQNSAAAAATLLKIMVEKEAPCSIRVRAAHTVLEHAGRGVQSDDLLVRVNRLEQAGKDQDQYEWPKAA